MSKVTPKQVRAAIDAIRTRQLQITHGLEVYEAIIQNAPPYLLPKMQADVDALYKHNRDANATTRKYLKMLEDILAEDEAANGWKGEDRYIEIYDGNND